MKLIGVGGYARSGKDTFVSIAMQILANNGITCKKYSFASELKDDLDDWLKEKYGISAWTTNDAEKILIRPFLVAHGCGKRIQTEGKYWVDKVHAKIQEQIAMQSRDQYQDWVDVVFVSDVRFPNEAIWLHEKWNGELIHLKRYSMRSICDGGVKSPERILKSYKVYDPAPNDEELKNDPLVMESADQRIEWENKGNLDPFQAEADPYLREIVFKSLNATKAFSGRLSQ